MPRRFRAVGRWSAAVAALLLLGLFAAAFLIDEPLRRRMERDLNRWLVQNAFFNAILPGLEGERE